MKSIKIQKILLPMLLITLIIFTLSACTKNTDNGGPTSNESVVNKKENKIITDDYEAKIYFDGDHYVLNVFTNLYDGEIKITYDNTKFLLDDTGVDFERARFEEAENKRSFLLTLESNNLYEFNFIKLSDEEPVLGENILIEK